MRRAVAAADPDAYVDALSGWQRVAVEKLRKAVLASGAVDEAIKWGHLVYFSNGPVLLIRAEAHRVLLGFWRGQRLREIYPPMKPGGKYEMASTEFHENDELDTAVVLRLAKEAVRLNRKLGDPTDV